jgi:hypothetical protein
VIGSRFVFPGPQGIVALRGDGRLVLLPARAAAGSRGRRGRPRLLPELPGRPFAVGFEGRWILVRCRFDGEDLLLRIPPRSDDYERQCLGEASPACEDGLRVVPDPAVEWPACGAVGDGDRALRLGGGELLVTAETADGAWMVSSSRREGVRLSAPAGGRVVSPARVERELGLAVVEERWLWFVGSAGTARRTLLDACPEDAAACAGAPWLALLEGDRVGLRDLGSRWGRLLGRWSLRDC